MTIWHLLCATAFLAPLIFAAQTAHSTHAGVGGYIVSVSTGLLVGIVCAWALWFANKKILARFSDYSALLQALAAALLFATGIAWIVIGAVCGERATVALLHIL